MRVGIRYNSICQTLHVAPMAPTMLKHCGCRFTQTVEYVVYISRIDFIQRTNCLRNLNYFCRYKSQFKSQLPFAVNHLAVDLMKYRQTYSTIVLIANQESANIQLLTITLIQKFSCKLPAYVFIKNSMSIMPLVHTFK